MASVCLSPVLLASSLLVTAAIVRSATLLVAEQGSTVALAALQQTASVYHASASHQEMPPFMWRIANGHVGLSASSVRRWGSTLSSESNNSSTLFTEWDNHNICLAVLKFKPYISRYSNLNLCSESANAILYSRISFAYAYWRHEFIICWK